MYRARESHGSASLGRRPGKVYQYDTDRRASPNFSRTSLFRARGIDEDLDKLGEACTKVKVARGCISVRSNFAQSPQSWFRFRVGGRG
jgi:hypothetical protein